MPPVLATPEGSDVDGSRTPPGSVPFTLILSRPSRVLSMCGPSDLFATVSDGQHVWSVVDWPWRCAEFPIPLSLDTVLFVQLYPAMDLAIFQQCETVRGSPVAWCTLPLRSIAKLMDGQTASNAGLGPGAPQTDDGNAGVRVEAGIPDDVVNRSWDFFDIWVALDTPQGFGQAMDLVFAANNLSPTSPPCEATPSGGTTESDNAGESTYSDCEERFELSRRIARMFPLRPKLNIIIEPLSRAEEYHWPSSCPSAAAFQNATISQPSTQMFLGGGLGSRVLSRGSPSRSPTQSPLSTTPPPAEPDPLEQPAIWQRRCEEEHARLNRLKVESEKTLREMTQTQKALSSSFELVANSLNLDAQACQFRHWLQKWREWFCMEKATRQFKQLFDELEQERTAHDADVEEKNRVLQAAVDDIKKSAAKSHWHRRRRGATTAAFQAVWSTAAALQLMGLMFSCWCLRAQRLLWLDCARNHLYEPVFADHLLRYAFAAWGGHLAALDRDKRRIRTREVLASIPRMIQVSTRQRSCEVLDFTTTWRIRENAAECAQRVFRAWGRNSRSACRWRCGVVHFIWRQIRETLLRRSVASWLCAVGSQRTNSSVDLQRIANEKKTQRLQERARHSAQEATLDINRYFLVSCVKLWHLGTVKNRMQAAIDQVLRERDTLNETFSGLEAKSERLRSSRRAAQEYNNDAKSNFDNEVRAAAGELAELVRDTESKRSRCVQLVERLDATQRVNECCLNELAIAKEKYTDLSDQYEAKELLLRQAEADFKTRILESESELEYAYAEQGTFRAEVAEQREGRRHDIKDVKAKAKTEARRAEAVQQEAAETRGAEQSVAAAKFGKYEARRRELELEVKGLQRELLAKSPQRDMIATQQTRLRQRIARANARLAKISSSSCLGELESAIRQHGVARRSHQLMELEKGRASLSRQLDFETETSKGEISSSSSSDKLRLRREQARSRSVSRDETLLTPGTLSWLEPHSPYNSPNSVNGLLSVPNSPTRDPNLLSALSNSVPSCVSESWSLGPPSQAPPEDAQNPQAPHFANHSVASTNGFIADLPEEVPAFPPRRRPGLVDEPAVTLPFSPLGRRILRSERKVNQCIRESDGRHDGRVKKRNAA